MRFSFSDEQEQFRAVVRRFLDDHAPPSAARACMASALGHDEAVWARLADDLGASGIHLDEAHGGQGFGQAELGIIMEEMGRALLCAPYFGSAVLAAGMLRHGATVAEQAELLPPLASGARRAALAWVEDAGRWDAAGITLAAGRDGAAWRLDGRKRFVVDGLCADDLLVLARVDGALALFLVAGDARGLARRALEVIDPTRRLAEVDFTATPARRLGADVDVDAGFARLFDEALVALAGETIGGARRLHAEAVEYARLRMQFGRPIGSFQAIKHQLADRLLDIELAAAAVNHAAAALDENDPAVSAFAAQAKAMASEAGMAMAACAIQVHGGIGFTWDHDTHLWYKRAKSSEVLLGTPAWHRERYLAALEANA
ncbi:MAG: acyl-CoA dehydrogenase family protein [Gammaproteobacteria bacterium]|nr:acyl-CoA dehydrogenase family protein [Gammaproteobacteria bacterium]MCP5202241.1 acyl-CoA dehydrogenase family protein [Gammaproteobacteria bacterium]